MPSQRKAVALISGGLDAVLAARLIPDQGIHVQGLNFCTGFCVEGHTYAIRSQIRQRPRRSNALWVAETLRTKLHVIDVIAGNKRVVLTGVRRLPEPVPGLQGVHTRQRAEVDDRHGCDFITTGEVLGQRPKS
jgi:tRNA U34 2-thiouridine synthase MnmA/TrmU